MGCEEKKTAVHAEMERMSKLPANSNYAMHRMRVLNKILHLMSTQVRMLYNHIVKGYLVDIRLFKCVTVLLLGRCSPVEHGMWEKWIDALCHGPLHLIHWVLPYGVPGLFFPSPIARRRKFFAIIGLALILHFLYNDALILDC